MPNYGLAGSETLAAGSTILYGVNGATSPRRIALHHVILGASGTPDDQAAQIDIQRIDDENATPGGVAKTPVPLDEGDPAALSNGVEAPTGEPTYETALAILELGLNQRATFQWIATPGKEPRASAAEDTGFGAICVAVTTGWACSVTMHYSE